MPSNYTRRISLYINGKEVKNDIASIKAEMNKLVGQQARMTIGSKEYVKAGKSIRELKGILTEHSNNLRTAATGWDRMKRAAEGMNRYFLMISSAVAGLGGLLMAGKKAVSMFAEFDDQVADVKRTTGMTRDEIYGMNESLKKVDTRTAQLDLMKLGEIAGKLGIAKNDIEGFITAADKISVALSGALGADTEEAINQIGKMVDVFKVKDKFGIEDSMLKVGSALNSLGNASTANEGYIVEFTKRVGGIAPTVGVSIQSVMGLAATLDQLGQTSEVSSTVYSAMITGMFKKTGEYAKIAGMGIKEFKDLLGKDTNEAFIKVLEGLKGTNGGMERLVALMGDIGMDGKRSASVLGVLSNNTQLLREQQDVSNASFEKGTGILDAFNSKNNSAQALLDKARKRMDNLAVSLGEKLLPVLTLSTNGFSYFVKYVGILVDFTIKHSTAILTIGAALAAYTIASKAAAVIEAIRLATSKQSVLLAQIETNWIRLKILLTNEATMAQKRALVANKALGASMTATPWGAIAAAVVLVTMAIIEFVKHAGKASAAQEAINDARKRSTELVVDEKSKVDLLVSLINSENVSMAGKKKAIEDLKKIIPGYNALLNDQGKVIYQNTESVKDYITQLRRQYMLQGYQEQFGKANMNLATARDERDTYVSGLKGGKPKTMSQRVKLDNLDKEIADQESVVIALQSKVESSLNAMDHTKENVAEAVREILKIEAAMNNTALDVNGKPLITVDMKTALQTELDGWKSKYLELTGQSKTVTTIPGALGGGDGSGGDGSGSNTSDDIIETAEEKRQREAEEKRLKAIEDAYKQQHDIRKKAIESSIATMEDGYQKELYTLHAAYADQREAILHELDSNTKLTAEEKGALNSTLLDLDKKYVSDYDKLARENALQVMKHDKELLDLKLEGVRSGSAEEYQLQKQLLDKQMLIDVAEVTGNEEQKAQKVSAIKAKYARMQAKEDEKWSLKFLDDKLKEDITALNNAERQKLAVLRAQYDAGEISQKDYNKRRLAIQAEYTQKSLKIAIDKAQQELDILKTSGEDTTQAEEALAELRLKAQQAGTAKESGDTGDWEEWSTEDKLNMAVDTAQQIADAGFQISRDKNQRELDNTLSKLQKERNAELANKNLTETQKDAINQQYDAKERAAKQDAWKKQHKADITQAWVNLALGVGKAAINMWPVPAIPMMAAAAVSGGLQVAAVTSQKMPEFYEGGFTAKDSSNKTPAGIVHANEYVIPEQGVNNPSLQPVLKMIEVARQSGNLPRLSAKAIVKSLGNGFRNGGATTAQEFLNDRASYTQKPQADERDALLMKSLGVIDKLSQKLDEGIEATVAIRGRKGLYEKMEEDKQSQKNFSL